MICFLNQGFVVEGAPDETSRAARTSRHWRLRQGPDVVRLQE